jgi:hypothetical protein
LANLIKKVNLRGGGELFCPDVLRFPAQLTFSSRIPDLIIKEKGSMGKYSKLPVLFKKLP